MVTSRAPTSKKTATGAAARKPAAKKADAAAVDARKPAAKKAVAAKPAVKKAAAKTAPAVTPAKKTAAKKTGKPLSAGNVAAKSESGSRNVQKRNVSPEERYQMIAAAAYWRAERRNFAAGGALDDWIAAEAEIDALLKAGE
ncbi:MAG: DUF2934 domain-containing protein [Nitrosomonadales bacterium]|nr:DUF2934 domain-containing protein [Nitrosomonadales bacterium]